jgi:hypothetical protein
MYENFSPLDIQSSLTQPSGNDQSFPFLLTLHNQSTSETITNIAIRIEERTVVIDTQSIDMLLPGQSTYLKFEVPIKASCPYLSTSYNFKNNQNSLARAIDLTTLSKDVNAWSQVISPLLSIFGIITGAWLVHLFTKWRDRQRALFDWSKMLFERYEKAYRDFLTGWGGIPSATVLETQFKILQHDSLVPSRIINEYNKTFSVLSHSQNSEAIKLESCQIFQEAINRFLSQPWFFQLDKPKRNKGA